MLSDILLYHVVAGTTVYGLCGANTVTAANGDELTITVSDTEVAVGDDGAVVTLADVPASMASYTSSTKYSPQQMIHLQDCYWYNWTHLRWTRIHTFRCQHRKGQTMLVMDRCINGS